MVIARKNVKNTKELDEWLAKCRKIKIKGKESCSIDYIVAEFIDTGGDGTPVTVYKTNTLHCHKNRFRSVLDVIVVMKHYHENMSFKDCLTAILDYYWKEIKNSVTALFLTSIYYCPDVKRYNFRGNTYFTKKEFNDITYKYSIRNTIIASLLKDFSELQCDDVTKYVDSIFDSFQ